MKQNNKEGFLYAASNLAMPSCIKIGYTNNDVSTRLKQLSNSSVPYSFELECVVKVFDASAAEATIHNLLKSYRINHSEFFIVDVNLVKDLFKTIENNPDINKSGNAKSDNELVKGQIINLKNPEYKAKIISNNKILYEGILYRFHQFINLLQNQRFDLDDWQIGESKLSDLADKLIY